MPGSLFLYQMATRTIYIVPARQGNTFPFASFPARTVTVTRRVPIPARPTPNATPADVGFKKPAKKSVLTSGKAVLKNYPEPIVRKRQASSELDPAIEEILGYRSAEAPPVRKRERLSHLTAEEKLNRRKLKNRVAAQTARDRKKIRTCKLEEAVRKLVAENELLRAENKRITEMCDELKFQKHELEKVLDEERQQRGTNTSCNNQSSFGSAASIRGPQQREQAIVLLRVLLLLSFLTSTYKKSSTTSGRKTVNLNSFARKCLVAKKKKSLPLLAKFPVPRKSAARLEWIARNRISI